MSIAWCLDTGVIDITVIKFHINLRHPRLTINFLLLQTEFGCSSPKQNFF